jgi:hypothetical protein
MFGQLADILVCSRGPSTAPTAPTSSSNAAGANANSSSSPSATLSAATPSTVCVYLEEVPVDYSEDLAHRLCQSHTRGHDGNGKDSSHGTSAGVGAGASNGACTLARFTLEYGKTDKPLGERDPFALDRVGLTGETSHFLHPVMRSFKVTTIHPYTIHRALIHYAIV